MVLSRSLDRLVHVMRGPRTLYPNTADRIYVNVY